MANRPLSQLSPFDEIAEAEGRKISAVYKRRGKVTKSNDKTGDNTATDVCKVKNNYQKSWIDRCLSSRRMSVILDKVDLQRGCNNVPKVPCALQKFSDPHPFSPNSHQRKRVVAPAAPADFVREKQAHFAEVDAFELQEESPSPRKLAETTVIDDACLFRARNGHLEAVPEEFPGEAENFYLSPEDFLSAALRTPPVRGFLRSRLGIETQLVHDASTFPQGDLSSEAIILDLEALNINNSNQRLSNEKGVVNVCSPGLMDVSIPMFNVLLRDSNQERVLSLKEAISEFCDIRTITKIGEGTYGEAYKGNGNVYKIVPMDGDFRVNGESQKTSAEMYSEVLLSNTLNKLRDRTNSNVCSSFVETKATRICQGHYDKDLVHAWEKWNAEHNSENDHPTSFPEKQLYVVFVLADGGTDLESFVLLNFNEVRSVLLQVVLSLAVAEQACEFEHRDLHWGNIVLARKKEEGLHFRLEGRDLSAKAYGLAVSLIDFTLSRIDTGKQVIFCDLSDPSWFEGPEGDVQAETYRRMREVTNGRWDGRFPKNNSLWIHYVAEIIRKKKSFRCSPKDKRALYAFSKRALQYESATVTLTDKLFEGLWGEVPSEWRA